MKLDFIKMEGLGNDFVMVDNRNHLLTDAALSGAARSLCDRHFGVGADGLILMEEGTDQTDLSFTIINSDGSEAEMCGNGMRCFARFAYESGACRKTGMRINTRAGLIQPRLNLDADGRVLSVEVDMGEPVLDPGSIPYISETGENTAQTLRFADRTVTATLVSMGNPHAVIFTDDLKAVPLKEWGPEIETLPVFPNKTNVEFVEVVSRTEAVMGVWERGAGITLACGTGACAVLVAGVLEDRLDREVLIHLPGGDLSIFWDPGSGHVLKTGPARIVFSGQIDL